MEPLKVFIDGKPKEISTIGSGLMEGLTLVDVYKKGVVYGGIKKYISPRCTLS